NHPAAGSIPEHKKTPVQEHRRAVQEPGSLGSGADRRLSSLLAACPDRACGQRSGASVKPGNDTRGVTGIATVAFSAKSLVSALKTSPAAEPGDVANSTSCPVRSGGESNEGTLTYLQHGACQIG